MEEQTGERSTLETTKSSSEVKLVCGRGQYTRYELCSDNDTCDFCEHLKGYPYVPFGKSGFLELPSTLHRWMKQKK